MFEYIHSEHPYTHNTVLLNVHILQYLQQIFPAPESNKTRMEN